MSGRSAMMNQTRILFFINMNITYLLFVAFVGRVACWNSLCREAIESTAMSAITLERLRRLKALLRGHDLVDYTWWADEVLNRIPTSIPLHYQHQKDATCASFDAECGNELCLIGGLKYFFARLMNSGYAAEDAPKIKHEVPKFPYPKEVHFSPVDCIKYIVVLLSDLHHPLHLDFDGAEALSTLPVILDGHPELQKQAEEQLGTKEPSFAAFLRNVFVPQYIKRNEDSWYGSWTNAELLGPRYKLELDAFNRNTSSSFEIWGAETANLNCTSLLKQNDVIQQSKGTRAVRYTDELGARLGNLLKSQILLAGVRVAIVISYILVHREIGYHEETGLIVDIDPKSVWTWEDYMVFPATLILFGFFYGMFYIVYKVLKEAWQEYRSRYPKKEKPKKVEKAKYKPVSDLSM